MWIPTNDLAHSPGHPFYKRLNRLLAQYGFDEFAEEQCQSFYAERLGLPSIPPGMYFRLLLIGYFEGIDSEREIAWRVADSLPLREFQQILSEALENLAAVAESVDCRNRFCANW